MPIRLVVVDDHPALVRGLVSLFESEGFILAGDGDCASDLVELTRKHRPDVAVADLSMPGDTFSAISSVTEGGVPVVVFTAYAEPTLAMRAFQAGSLGFVLKGRPSSDLFDAVRAAHAGQVFVSPGFATGILGKLRPGAQGGDDFLSVRERQIVNGLLEGKTNKEIARELALSEKTIKHYMTNLMAKLNAKNRLDVVRAVRGGVHANLGASPVDQDAGSQERIS